MFYWIEGCVGGTIAACAIFATIAQASPNWSDMASLPFAFAAASFLIWSIVQLLRMMFDAYKSANSDTVSVLRQQVADLRKFQDETLVTLLEKVTTAMHSDSEASHGLRRAWEEVHEDFRDLISALRVRPCLHDSDLPKLDADAVEIIQHRRERIERNKPAG
jgi:hypothetical protein